MISGVVISVHHCDRCHVPRNRDHNLDLTSPVAAPGGLAGTSTRTGWPCTNEHGDYVCVHNNGGQGLPGDWVKHGGHTCSDNCFFLSQCFLCTCPCFGPHLPAPEYSRFSVQKRLCPRSTPSKTRTWLPPDGPKRFEMMEGFSEPMWLLVSCPWVEGDVTLPDDGEGHYAASILLPSHPPPPSSLHCMHKMPFLLPIVTLVIHGSPVSTPPTPLFWGAPVGPTPCK